jgi:hypothetical protein
MPSTCYLSQLDGSEKTYLTEDPAEYQDGSPERRQSSHAVADGRVWQDFGVATTDRTLEVRADYVTGAVLAELQSKFTQAGKVWLWHDHKGHEYRVFFRSLRSERIRGHDAYRLEMLLDVVEVVA